MSIDSAVKGSICAHIFAVTLAVVLGMAGHRAAPDFFVIALLAFIAFMMPASYEITNNKRLTIQEKVAWLLRIMFTGSFGAVLYTIRRKQL